MITESTGILTKKLNKISNISAINEEIFFYVYWSHVKSSCEVWIVIVTVKTSTHSADIVSKVFLCELEVGVPFSI